MGKTEAFNDVGRARGRLQFLLDRKGKMDRDELWEIIEKTQKDLGDAVMELKEPDIKDYNKLAKFMGR